MEKKLEFKLGNKKYKYSVSKIRSVFEENEFTAPISKLITSSDSSVELMQKVALDVEDGKEEVKLPFENIIYSVFNDSTLPKTVDVPVNAYHNTIFLEHAEGGEVNFGTLSKDQPQKVDLKVYASALQHTLEMVKFNQQYAMTEKNRAFGSAWRKLKNKMQFAPILDILNNGTGTGPQGETTEALSVRVNKTFQKGITDYESKKGVINKPVLVYNPVDEFKIKGGIKAIQTADGDRLPNLEGYFADMIPYKGDESITIGAKTYDFPGVPPGKVAFVEPKRKARFYVKENLNLQHGGADLSRLIEDQIVGYGIFGLYIAAEDIVQKVTLP
jgi:hypothetical protein